mmetsp:Transcript_69802/g.175832  ORF Transcript_69802/g.175832 Transcript_69802/m.175832 type:complete len:256 (+) Transcript_69802:1982-2749(+)
MLEAMAQNAMRMATAYDHLRCPSSARVWRVPPCQPSKMLPGQTAWEVPQDQKGRVRCLHRSRKPQMTAPRARQIWPLTWIYSRIRRAICCHLLVSPTRMLPPRSLLLHRRPLVRRVAARRSLSQCQLQRPPWNSSCLHRCQRPGLVILSSVRRPLVASDVAHKWLIVFLAPAFTQQLPQWGRWKALQWKVAKATHFLQTATCSQRWYLLSIQRVLPCHVVATLPTKPLSMQALLATAHSRLRDLPNLLRVLRQQR